MPIYEYRCTECDKTIEKLVLNKDDIPEKCSCGGELKQVVSCSSFRLLGDWWYAPSGKSKPKQGVNNGKGTNK